MKDWLVSLFLNVGKNTLLILLLALFAQLKFNTLAKKVLRQLKTRVPSKAYQKRAETITGVIINSTGIIITLVAFMMFLSELGLDITPLITGAGIAGLAFGFGAQTLVKDVISGFFVILENQFNQGDMIEVAGKKGQVERLGLRTTLLKDDAGNRHLIPNSQLGIISILKKKEE